MSTFWIVGWIDLDYDPNGQTWGFVGLFDSEAKAVAACEDETFFIAPAPLNMKVPDEAAEWPGSYCPLSGEELIRKN